MLSNRRLHLLLITFSILTFGHLKSQTNCNLIDFESIPNVSLYEGLEVIDQYLLAYGLTFILEDGTFPRIAEVGPPTTAFESWWGSDQPEPSQDIGSFFLTDDGILSGLTSSPLIISFTYPIDSASGVVLDVDLSEKFTIQARDQIDTVLFETVITDGDPNTGDGIASVWGFKRNQPDIYSIKFIGTRDTPGAFGLGFDNLVSCRISKSTSTAELNQLQSKIFPNPSSGDFIIKSKNGQISSIEIFDLSGNKLDFDVIKGINQVEIQCEYKGLAFVRFIINDSAVIKKLALL